MAHDIFISYATADQTVAQMVCATLEKQGLRCWMAPRDVQAGDDWGRAIVAAIKASRAMVLVFSGASNESHHIPREIERAIGREIPVVPVRIENVEPSGSLEYSLSSVHWLDAISPPVEAHIVKLADRLRTLIEGPADAGSAPAVAPNAAPPASPPVVVPIPHPEPVRPAAVQTPRSRHGLVVTGAVIATAVLVYTLSNRPPAPAVTPTPEAPSPTVTVSPAPALPPSPLPTVSPSPLPTVSPSPSPKATPRPPSTTGAKSREVGWYAIPSHMVIMHGIDRLRIDDLKRRAEVYRSDPRPAIELANAFYDAEQYNLAIPWYAEALHRSPANIDLLVDLAMSHWYLRQDAMTLQHLRDALTVSPNHGRAHLNMGVYYAGRNLPTLAIQEWQRVIKYRPDTVEADRAKELLNRIGAR